MPSAGAVASGLCLLGAAATLALGVSVGWRLAGLFLVGAGLGLALYHAAFGFTAAWRRFIVAGRGDGLRAQMLLLGLAAILFFPVLAAGDLLGRPVGGFIAPAGVSVLVGAFIFGVGMQLGGGCGSGTLYTLGGGSTRMLVTLAGFIIGSLAATHHVDWWLALPALPPISFIHVLGWAEALVAHLAIFSLIAWVTWRIERSGGSAGEQSAPVPRLTPLPARRLIAGPWPSAAGALALALLSLGYLALAGHPWGITSAFALWGAKLGDAAGLGVADWPYWQARAGVLEASVLTHTVSVSNFGIVLGALVAAVLAGRFAPVWRLPLGSLAAALLGGLLLGYGARLAFGCNIGAYLGGIVSGSLHGWLWLAAAFAGSIVGVRLRPWFGLPRS